MATRESPSRDWLPLVPSLVAVPNGAFATTITGWALGSLPPGPATAAVAGNGAVAVGAALGALALTITGGATGNSAQVLQSARTALNGRETASVAATVRTTAVALTPLLQLIFTDAAAAVVATITEADWTPVANTSTRRALSARVPRGATHVAIGLVAFVDTGPLTGTVYLDDVTAGAAELVVSDVAMGQLRVSVAVPGRWL